MSASDAQKCKRAVNRTWKGLGNLNCNLLKLFKVGTWISNELKHFEVQFRLYEFSHQNRKPTEIDG